MSFVSQEIDALGLVNDKPLTINPQAVGQARVCDVERDLIIQTLDCCSGNRTRASKILGISIRTLRNKINIYQAQGYDLKTQSARHVSRTVSETESLSPN